MAKDRVIAAIDIGTTKICCLVGGVGRDGKTEIIGIGVGPSHGLKKGMVVDIEAAAASIQVAIERAEKTSGYKIASAVVGISGDHVQSLNNRGVIAVNHADRVITADDVGRVIEAARAVAIPSDREIIAIIPRSYTLDQHQGVRNPLGMHGFRLEVETHIVTGAITTVQNLTKCVNRTGLDVDDLVLQPIASAESVLTEEEKESGVLLADIGGGTTDLSVFIDGSVWHTASLPVGGNHLTNDLSIFTRAPANVAEELKIAYGSATPNMIAPDETAEIPAHGDDPRQDVSRRQLCEVIEARVEEMVGMIVADVKRSGYDGLLPSGIVLCGGTANLRGIDSLTRELLGLPVRVGRPRGLRGLTEKVSDPAYATSVGLLLWGLKHADTEMRGASGGRRAKSGSGGGLFGRIMNWGRDLLPQ